MQDFQIFVRQRFGGISRYHLELNRNILSLGEKSFIKVAYPQCEYLKQTQKVYRYPNKLFRNSIYILNEIVSFFYVILMSLSEKPIDIIHVSWYKTSYIKALNAVLKSRRPKVVITVYDLIHEMTMNANPIMKKGAIDRQNALRLADGIICISENTKKDLFEYYPEAKSKPTKVIYLSSDVVKNTKREIKVTTPYILYVGNRDGYKNFSNFIVAVAEILKLKKEYIVFCAGGGDFKSEELSLFERLGIKANVVQKNVSDNELAELYQNASCFVFPSLYEGFGIPILEAFNNECPIAIHNGSCFPEIAKDAAAYFDGKKVDSILSTIMKILDDDIYRSTLVEKGKIVAASYSWEKTASSTINFYKEILRD